MCGPKPPAPVAPRQAPRAPDAGSVADRSQAALLRRQTMSGMVFTDQNRLGAPMTAGKPVLGA